MYNPPLIVSSNPAHGDVHPIQLYVIKCVSHWFSPGTPVSFTNKTDQQDITEILLKVALNTISLALSYVFVCCMCPSL